MQTDPSNKENNELLIQELQKQLETAKNQLEESTRRSGKFEQDWSNLFDQNKLLREENHRLQQGYETLRIQKGGFGFKSMMFSGMGGFFTALVLCFIYVKLFRPKPEIETIFAKFGRENLFNYEWNINQGNFEAVEKSLLECSQRPEYHAILPQIEFTEKIVGAAHRRCASGR